jgi:hypothetical protein
MLLPTIYVHTLFQGYIDRNLIWNNVLTMHLIYLAWEYFYPIADVFSFKLLFTNITFLIGFPCGTAGILLGLKFLNVIHAQCCDFNFINCLSLCVFSLFFVASLIHSACDSDFAK